MVDIRHQATLIALVERTDWLMSALQAARGIGLQDWCLGAGLIRHLVWDQLHGYPNLPSPESDADLVYFDRRVDPEADDMLTADLNAAHPALRWEVTNQAWVHLWRASDDSGYLPARNLEDAISAWPETATAVGVCLDDAGKLKVIAPFGLDDLFAGIVRRNAPRVSLPIYQQRLAEKRFGVRWPRLQIIPD